ncbi:Tektin-2, putative [Pediculus humanus corporis]|uniref:Tektin n=1 Tax=Pediculus humanus subsp. corporis TaxID=121224 RepID=E0VVW0_PEDHC|nr:Tektin-2, putative [Pediculus humanus corporis]EEB17516.1 Tektin-2, putative [Pediculus humanus corporis]
MSYTISMAEKPIPHISEADWKAKIWNMKAVGQTKAENSYELRNDVRQTRNEAVIIRRWTNYHNNLKISDRLTEIRRWMNKLGGALQNLKLQSELLMADKFETEKEIEKYCCCLNTISECRFLRDSKNKLNLVNDNVGQELQSEIESLESTKKYLSEKCFSAWEQNNRITSLIYTLENDIADKGEALEIDLNVLKLDSTSASATYKPDVLRLPDKVLPIEVWLERAQANCTSADNECLTATKMRESLSLARERSRMDYLAQYEATNYALRKRSYETLRLKTELEYQKKNILDEMEKLSKELERLKMCKEETINYLKCAESRLESRNQRPANEATRDDAQIGLHEEVVKLRQTIEDLDAKIAKIKSTYNQMESYILELETEIKYQEQSIKLDDQALSIHESILQMIPISQIDKTIELFNMSKELPPEQPVVL